MDVIQLVNRLAQSTFVQNELPMQMQLGLPWLEKRGEHLCMSFLPHREAYQDGKLMLYAAQYELSWVYPFQHIASFRNLTLENGLKDDPVCVIEGERLLEYGSFIMQELYQECGRVLDFQENNGHVSDVTLRKYQQRFVELTERLGMDAFYRKK